MRSTIRSKLMVVVLFTGSIYSCSQGQDHWPEGGILSDFCLRADKTDSLFLHPRIYGIPFKGDLWNPSRAIDVILYTEQPHLFARN